MPENLNSARHETKKSCKFYTHEKLQVAGFTEDITETMNI